MSCIEDSHFRALSHPRQRKICRHRRLTDSALARSDRDDVPDSCERRELPLHGMRGDFLREVDFDACRSATGAHIARESAREFITIAANRKAQAHANVTRITLHFGDFDCQSRVQRLSEIWVRIFFDECAKFGGSNGRHKVCVLSAGDLRGRDSSENTCDAVRIGCCRQYMWHNF
jgi:hypothetical protein